MKCMGELQDVAIVGGGPAGLSAALVLGRARRTVVLFDAGEQNNLPAAHVGGLFGHDGTPPAELYRQARAQLEPYPTVVVREATVASVRREHDGFTVTTDGGEVHARRLLLATGMRYELPDLPGLRELWGDTVFHCPFCHGWEVRDRRLAVLAEGDELVERALLLRNWSEDIVALANGSPDIGVEASARLERAGIELAERPIVELRRRSDRGAPGPRLAGVVFDDGSVLERDGRLVGVSLTQRSPFAAELGLELTERDTIAVDNRGRTSLAGVYAAGDIAEPIQQVVIAAAAGGIAAASIVHEFVTDAIGAATVG
jgi:thioredoxin reductase